MLFSLFLAIFPNKLLNFVCIWYLVVFQWLHPWATTIKFNSIEFNSLGLLITRRYVANKKAEL